ncbi:MAG: hypothetical protein RML84_11165, partial [Anaerolineae bacterium]|nr:hypothetical protein [Anaerolineae bacterium]
MNHYRYCYATTSGCTPNTLVLSTVLSVTVGGLAPNTTYYWQVRACANADCTSFLNADNNEYWRFDTIQLPSAFNKVSPADGAANQPLALTLQWQAASGATSYRYCYDLAALPNCVPNLNAGNATSVTVSGLQPGTTYRWQVRACKDTACQAFTDANGGAHWTFTTVGAPAAFGKQSPLNGATNVPVNVTLQWSASSGGQGTLSYQYCINTVALCNTWVSVGSATNVALTLSPGTQYYWQVRVCDSANVCTEADNGLLWSFTTAALVGSFSKFAPGDNAVNVNPATDQLQWSPASGATEYKVCLGTSINACNVLGGGPGQYASVGNTTFRVLSDLNLQPNTTYYWQVIATNGTYTTPANGNYFAFWSFKTLPTGPANFTKASPSFNATNVPTSNVTFQWFAASGAVSYTVCVGALVGDCTYSATTTGLSATIAGPFPAGATLLWQVTAHNAGGVTGADNGTWWPFSTVPPAPQGFSKLSPPNNAQNQPAGLLLSWEDVTGETSYSVCVGTTPGVCALTDTLPANTTVYTLTNLALGTQYFWQVSACNPGGCTPANNGVFWSFKTANPALPGPFQKTSPANGATNVPTNTALVQLTWTSAQDASGYEVCLGTQPGTCDLSGGGFQNVSNVTGIFLSQLPFSVTLQPGSTYYWQVRAYNAQTATRTFADNGVDFYFTTVSAPSAPSGFSKEMPTNGSGNVPTASVTLKWFASSGATSYEVCVGTAVNSCNALPGNTWRNVGNSLQTVVVNLQPGTAYYWQVRAVGPGGVTPANGGAWWQFSTAAPPQVSGFTKLSPLHLSTNVPTSGLTLQWQAASNATGYEVCVGLAAGQCEVSGGWQLVGNVTVWSLPVTLLPSTSYWWQVRALGGATPVMANEGQWWSFTTVAPPPPAPGAFSKAAPVNGATGVSTSPVLSWTVSSGATSYELCLGTQANTCDVFNWVSVGNSTSFAASGLVAGTTYWWQVRAVNANGQTLANGGQWWYFTTAAAPAAPGAFNKQVPVNGATGVATSGVTLQWSSAAGASGYEVCVGTAPGVCDVASQNLGSTASSFAPSGLQAGTTYWWQVVAVNASGQTPANGGQAWYFVTAAPAAAPGAFNKQVPVNGATGVATSGVTL